MYKYKKDGIINLKGDKGRLMKVTMSNKSPQLSLQHGLWKQN